MAMVRLTPMTGRRARDGSPPAVGLSSGTEGLPTAFGGLQGRRRADLKGAGPQPKAQCWQRAPMEGWNQAHPRPPGLTVQLGRQAWAAPPFIAGGELTK